MSSKSEFFNHGYKVMIDGGSYLASLSFGWVPTRSALVLRRSLFFWSGLVLLFLSSLGIIFPNADLRDQIDLLLNFHPAAIRALWVDR